MKKLLLLLLCSSSLFGQKISCEGKIVNKENGQPVVYAAISFIHKKYGTSSLEDGSFKLEITAKDTNKKIHISCLNYKDTIILVRDLMNKVIRLTPETYELEEIYVSRKMKKEISVDAYRRRDIKTSFGATKGNPWIITKFFRYKDSYDETPYIKDVTVYLGSWLMRKKGKFRLRFYEVDSLTNKPKKDLIRDNIIVTTKKRNGQIIVDVAKYELEIPKNGIYIGVERLEIPYNLYEYTYTMQGSRKKHKRMAVAPSIGAVYTKDTIYNFSRGKWRKFYAPKQFHKGYNIQPAISVTLTN